MAKKHEFKSTESIWVAPVQLICAAYIVLSAYNHSMNPKDWIKQKEEHNKYYQTVNFSYDSLLHKNINNTNFINLLNKYIPFKDKEIIIKESKLENNVK